ncbi:hypothetical protein ANOBCDAF_04063 [Pleomorphomonas sp. T1.2MG-36]|nr:hypothetical protein ANOBCDAF_04063 [Pleomorphomonas sp. T1.2MG-36]
MSRDRAAIRTADASPPMRGLTGNRGEAPRSPAGAMPDVSHLCEAEGPAIAAWPFWLYSPVGVVVLLVRSLLLASFGGIGRLLPRHWRPVPYPLLRRLLGIVVERNLSTAEIVRLTDKRIVAVNHVSVLDTLAMTGVGRPNFLSGTALRGESTFNAVLFRLVELISGARLIPAQDRRALADLFRSWRSVPEESSFYVPAEMTINNGRGLFRFHPTLIDRGVPVVPLAIRLTTSLGLVAHPFMSGGLATLSRLLMAPRLRFELTYLPALSPVEGEDGQAFADRVQRAVADHLGIPTTTHTVEAKRAYRERLRQTRRAA